MDFASLVALLVNSIPDMLVERRRQLRESDILDQEMSFMEYLTKSDPVWSTTLDNWPHPTFEAPHPELQREIDRLNPEIRSTLRSHGLSESLEKAAILISQGFDPRNPPPGPYTPQKLLRVYLEDPDHPTSELHAARDALRTLLQRLGNGDVHVDLIWGSNCTNITVFLDDLNENSDYAKIQLATRLAMVSISDKLEGRLLGQTANLLPCITRQYGRDVPALLIGVNPFTRANWVKMRELVLQELHKYTKMYLDVEFAPAWQVEDRVDGQQSFTVYR